MNYYPLMVTYAGLNPASVDPNSPGNRDHYFISDQPGILNMSGKPCTEGWLGQTNDWSYRALGEFNTVEEAREAIQKHAASNGDEVFDSIDETSINYYDEEDVVEVWVVKNMHRGDLITVDWDSQYLDINIAEDVLWLVCEDPGNCEYHEAWTEAAQELDLDPEDESNRDDIIKELECEGWMVEVASDVGWGAWYCVGRPPQE